MKEIRTPFGAPMIKALLRKEAPKRMTRRLVKDDIPAVWHAEPLDTAQWIQTFPGAQPGDWLLQDKPGPLNDGLFQPIGPKYQVGDILVAIEAWRTKREWNVLSPSELDPKSPIWFEAAGEAPREWDVGRYRHARFMPTWASRIRRRIIAVHPERLQDIDEDDALAEGIEERSVIIGANADGGSHREITGTRYYFEGCDDEGFLSPISAFKALWESIYGAGSWEQNRWVWVYEFEETQA